MADTIPNPKPRLTYDEAVEVWRHFWAGEFQHHIAARFGVNPARVNEVVKEHKHLGSRQAALQG